MLRTQRNQKAQKKSYCLAFAGVLLGLMLEPEDGGDNFPLKYELYHTTWLGGGSERHYRLEGGVTET
jgi:hypothetical protein